jgi:hypothetical protein
MSQGGVPMYAELKKLTNYFQAFYMYPWKDSTLTLVLGTPMPLRRLNVLKTAFGAPQT